MNCVLHAWPTTGGAIARGYLSGEIFLSVVSFRDGTFTSSRVFLGLKNTSSQCTMR